MPLATWYTYHYLRTGYVFGNPEFFRYNVSATLDPTRFFLALALRIWQLCGYLHLWILTLATLLAMWMLPPEQDSGFDRPRIGIPEQTIFYVVIATYALAMAMIGGAVLARYLLPAIPLVIILCVSTIWRRVRYWTAVVAFVALAFVAAWFWNPPYGFSPEDNLAYRDYVILHEDGEHFLEARYPMARVLTAWPASDEITRPWLGYITRPMRVVRIEDFSLDHVLSAAGLHPDYDVALVFSTKYESPTRILGSLASVRADQSKMEKPLLRISSRSSACRSSPDTGRTDRIFGTASPPVDRDNRKARRIARNAGSRENPSGGDVSRRIEMNFLRHQS